MPTVGDDQEHGDGVRTSQDTQIRLTDRHLRAFSKLACSREVRDTVERGLIAQVLPSGLVRFTLRYRARDAQTGRLTQRRLKLGEYPALSLQKARQAAREVRVALDHGRDPAAEQRAQRAAPPALPSTVAALAHDYIERHAKRHKRSWKDDDRMLRREVLPHWKDRPIRDVSRRDITALVEGIAARGAPVTANRVIALLSRMFRFALDEDLISASPAVRIPRLTNEQERRRERVLTDNELRRFWTACEELPAEMAAFYKLRLLTAQRGGEVASMRWPDVDLDAGWWTIPSTVTKNKRMHRVPLNEPALTILTTLRTAVDERLRRPRDDGRPHEPPIYVLQNARGKRQQSEAAATFKIVDFRAHDLRRTAATNMAAAGVPSEHVSRVLNHAEGGPKATHIYNRYAYDTEKRAALDTWARTLTQILETQEAGMIVPFEKRA